MKVVFCWAEISGYMSACFRELMKLPDIEPYVLAFASGRGDAGASFSDEVVSGVPCRLLEMNERADAAMIQRIVVDENPDVLVLCGWFHPAYRTLMKCHALAQVPIVMTMDTPWWGRARQWAGRLLLRQLLKRIAVMVVTGERSWQYAIRLGLPQSQIRRGMYGVDHKSLTQCLRDRNEAGAWPRQFLFAGRYSQEKAIDLLVAGYRSYRRAVESAGETAWPLVCCGTGPQATLFDGVRGVTNMGFVQPKSMLLQMAKAGVFVLPSQYDPWPLAIVEACAAGLPVIATEACGSSVELIRSEFNGYIIPTGSSESFANAMVQAHREYDRLPVYGERASQFAAAYSSEIWAARFARIFKEVLTSGGLVG